MSVSDLKRQFLLDNTGLSVGTISDLEWAYYSNLSGLSPKQFFSIADHKRTYFNNQVSTTTTTTETNLALNPRTVSGGAVSWLNNGGAIWTREFITTGVPVHPLGITAAVRCHVIANATNASAFSLYDIDGLNNTGGSRYAGVWVYCTGSGYEVYHDTSSNFPTILLTANTWTWVASTAANLGYIELIVVKTLAAATAYITDLVYATGLTVKTSPVTSFFDGATVDTGTINYSWTGVADSSSSTAVTSIVNASPGGTLRGLERAYWISKGVPLDSYTNMAIYYYTVRPV